ncbi:methyltransferase domain-containing protein [Streptomyces sp. HNM0574]|uniref:methyltransferase domain-containing protein n=1 Tax=Streptomyces sp. HNM0574 TaxID=2714954 RepID=UPI00146BBE0A|nr:methyltransferase domain-containing protein [Streptomyces sp. HNM0574]NLU69757.1 methyltransferase domain-containing protein [Streptomyces sp. HNM0574]
MAPALVQHRHLAQHTRDWAEIQERMLVPLFEAAYERMDVGEGTRLLGLGCGSGLALLLAASRGASVVGVDADEARLALARERLLPEPEAGGQPWDARLVLGSPGEVPPGGPPPNLVTAFDALPSAEALARTAAGVERGTPVVLAGWGPAERCAAAPVLRLAARLADPAGPASASPGTAGGWVPGGRDDLEELALRSGLRLEGSGRVTCPFGYADVESAVRGLLSTGLYEEAVRATDLGLVVKELTEALHPHRRADGTVWMPNLFRYVIARTV